MRMIAMIIKLAPLAVFAAMSFTIARFGLDSLRPLAKMMACIYLTCLSFVVICLGLLLRFNGINIFKFVYKGVDGGRHEFTIPSDWTDVVVGAVILIAVILDQLVHISQARRRTRLVAAAHAEKSTKT